MLRRADGARPREDRVTRLNEGAATRREGVPAREGAARPNEQTPPKGLTQAEIRQIVLDILG